MGGAAALWGLLSLCVAAGGAEADRATAGGRGEPQESGTMPSTDHAVEWTFVGTEPGRPPVQKLLFDVRLRNPEAAPRWFLLPWNLAAERQTAEGGAVAVEVFRLAGPAKAFVGRFMGQQGFQAVLVPGGGDVTIRRLRVNWFGALPDGAVALEAIVAAGVTLGGADLRTWFAEDPECAATAAVSFEGAQLTSEREDPGDRPLPLAFAGERRVSADVRLQPAERPR